MLQYTLHSGQYYCTRTSTTDDNSKKKIKGALLRNNEPRLGHGDNVLLYAHTKGLTNRNEIFKEFPPSRCHIVRECIAFRRFTVTLLHYAHMHESFYCLPNKKKPYINYIICNIILFNNNNTLAHSSPHTQHTT